MSAYTRVDPKFSGLSR